MKNVKYVTRILQKLMEHTFSIVSDLIFRGVNMYIENALIDNF